ncbi:MAG: type II secretion system protein GspK, partial [Alphaproteobacteria bacterium]|nr:type II secretion system protein GspK [Alphaproteobacteria bacterium]
MTGGRQRGIALVAVLWALVLLAVIAATVSRESRTQSRLARNFVDGAQAEALADGGVHRAIDGLSRPVAAGGWRVDGTVYGWRRPDGEVRIRIEDEGGKVDLNRAGAALLRDLFLAAGAEPARAIATPTIPAAPTAPRMPITKPPAGRPGPRMRPSRRGGSWIKSWGC